MADDGMVRIGIRRAGKDAIQAESIPWRPYDLETGKELVVAGMDILSAVGEPLKVRITTFAYAIEDGEAEPHIRFAKAEAEEVVPEEEKAPE